MRALDRRDQARLDDPSAIRLLQRVAVIANETGSFRDAVQAALHEVCAYAGWPVGHGYFPVAGETDELETMRVWHLDDPDRFRVFREVTERTPLRLGIGLPGRVWASSEPHWIVDVSVDSNFPRNRGPEDIVVRGGFAFPVVADKEIVAVLEFYSDQPQRPDAQLLEIVSYVGTQLGRVAEREAAAHAIVTQAEQTQQLIELAHDAFISIDFDGTIRRWNAAAEAMFGWSRDEVIGQPLAETIIPPNYRDAHRRGLRRYLSTRQGRVLNRYIELSAIKRDGTEFPVELAIWPVEADGDTTFCAFIRDISERKAQEESAARALEHEREVVQRLQQLDHEKTNFVSSVSHELRTPLTSIKGYVDLVLDDDAVTGPAAEHLQIVRRNADRLGDLVEDILMVSRLESGAFTVTTSPTPVDALVEAVREACLPAADGAAVQIDVDVPEETGAVLADGSQIERALLNLLSNAVKFSPDGGRVQISARPTPRMVEIEVQDEGTGMSAEDVERAFQPFFRSADADQRAVPGTGLGLFIVKTIVDAHGGAIDIASAPGEGTVVTVRLPRA